METVTASTFWSGHEGYDRDGVFTLVVEPAPSWTARPIDDCGEVSLLKALNAEGLETEQVAGIEIVGFLDFSAWKLIPEVPILWRIPGSDPIPLVDLLKRQQRKLRDELTAGSAR